MYARRVAHPDPTGASLQSHAALGEVLDEVSTHGAGVLPGLLGQLDAYRKQLSDVDPDSLDTEGALAYWINLYNAGALHRAGEAVGSDLPSVLRVPGAFSGTWATIRGVPLSLEDIEHGKIRRFNDPRIHSALICGSASCPTLSRTPFTGQDLDEQLDDQMRTFLNSGGAAIDRPSNTIRLSRILKWYGADFQWPHAMPTLRWARPSATALAIRPWLSEDDANFVTKSKPAVSFGTYDWGFGCSVS